MQGLLLLLLLVVVGSTHATWYLLADDAKTSLDASSERAMPFYQRYDTVGLNKPTVLVVVPIYIPGSVQGCGRLVVDLPVYRTWPTNDTRETTTPIFLTLYQWRTSVPVGTWIYASRQAEPAITVSADPVGNANGTWAPTRDRGVYRFTFNLATPAATNSWLWTGLFFTQNKTAAGNALYWMGRCCETNTSLGMGRPFGYIDLYGFQPSGGTSLFRYAPTGTATYALSGQNMTLVALTAYMDCQPLGGSGQPLPRSFQTLADPTWDLVGAAPPSPTLPPVSPVIIGGASTLGVPMSPPPSPPAATNNGPISLPYMTPPGPIQTTASAAFATPQPRTPLSNVTTPPPPPTAVAPLDNNSATTWLIVAITSIAALIVIAASAIIYVIWQRRRMRRAPYSAMASEPDETALVELTPRTGDGGGGESGDQQKESVISQPPEMIVKQRDDMDQVPLDPVPTEKRSTPNLRPSE